MKAMLEVDEHHWWYRGRRRIIRAELDRLALPAGAAVLDAGCGSGRTLEELVATARCAASSSTPKPPRSPAARARGRDRPPRAASLGRRDVRPDHVPRRDRAHAGRPGDAARAAPGVQARRLAARDGPRVPGAVVAARRGQPPLPALQSPSLRFAAVEAGWLVERMTSFNTLLLAPPPRSGSPSAGAATTGPTRPSSSSARTG